MLRTLGAARAQVLRAVIGEALIVSVIASVLGIAAGYLVAAGIGALFNAVGFGLPTADASLAVRTVVIALIVGVGVTLVASLAPALKATRIPPIAALREGATLPAGRLARFTPWFAVVIAALGAFLIYNGLAGSGSLSNRMLGLGVGALLEFVAAGMTAKYVVPIIARVVGWPIERLSNRTGRLARENATRNPSRTAVTAAALMIGVGLVVFVSVFASGIKSSFFDALDRSVQGDLIIEASGGQSIPGSGAIEAVRQAEGVGVASPLRFADARVSVDGGEPGNEYFTAVEPETYAQVFRTDWQQGGSDELLARLGTGGAIVEQDWAKGKGLVRVTASPSAASAAGRRSSRCSGSTRTSSSTRRSSSPTRAGSASRTTGTSA
jgi:putative ABC transport system permease protein